MTLNTSLSNRVNARGMQHANTLNQNELNLLSYLLDHKFHSGDQLAEQFNVSRASISNWIKRLNLLDIAIMSVKGKGYQLASYISLLDIETLQSQLPSPLKFAYTEISHSTNDTVKHAFITGDFPIVATTEQQTGGRGRRGRNWVSPFGQNLYFSIGMELDLPITELSGLSLVVGLSITESLIKLGFPVQLKWPNDIYLQGQKLAGILVELDGAFDTSCRVIIGVGLNANMINSSPMTQNEVIDQAWTSLASFTGESVDRTSLLSHLLAPLFNELMKFSNQGMQSNVQRWNALDYFYNQPVKLLMPKDEITGISRGIDETGALLVETGDGIKAYIAGEISVRHV